MSDKKIWKAIDKNLLECLPNPTKEKYEIKIKVPELTFIGVSNQPDFAKLYITYYPNLKILDLKSLKIYVYQLRDIEVSYERLINVIYEHFIKMVEPERLRLMILCNPRGGISSRLVIDSDWKVRGGSEEYKDYLEQDEWNVLM